MANHVIDLMGLRFGKLLVVERADNVDNRTAWICSCDCGNKTVVRSSCLRHKGTKSCGCLIVATATKHGHNRVKKRTRTYTAWCGMKGRCTNPKDPFFKDYGGRGISYDARWNSFKNFVDDMGECPTGMSIDRVNNDLGYLKGNCRWATPIEQANNKRSNVLFEGKTIAQWARDLGKHPQTIYSRMKRSGKPYR